MPEDGKKTRSGRARVTSHGELSHVALNLCFERGFDRTTIDDIAEAAGISRRTFFRYFPSKNDLPWGEFSTLLDDMRDHLANTDPDIPLIDALRRAVIEFNNYPERELSYHRNRMWMLLNVPSLQAQSSLHYAEWRRVIAEYVANRIGDRLNALAPQAIAWACLGLCLGAYEQWLAHEDSNLLELLNTAFVAAESIFGIEEEPNAAEAPQV